MARRGRRKGPQPRERKLSVMVLQRTKDAMELVTRIEAYKSRLAAALAERYAPRLRPGEELPDYGLALELAVRDVVEALRRMIEIDDRVDHAAVDLDLLRLDRDRLVADELYPAAVWVRGSIDLAFGRKRGRAVHLMSGRTRRNPPALARQLRLAIRRLTDVDCELPPPKSPRAVVDRDGWIRQLKPGYLELRKLNHELGHGEHVVTALVINKRAEIKEFDLAYGDSLRFVQAGLKMARFDAKLIKNLKPYYRRRLVGLAS